MKPSAKRALLLPAWLERKLTRRWQAYQMLCAHLACGLQLNQGVLAGGVKAFLGLARPGSGAVGWRWGGGPTNGRRAAGWAGVWV